MPYFVFEVPAGRTKKDEKIKSVPGATKLYFLRGEIFLVCSVHSCLHFTLLAINFLLVVFKIILYPHIKQMTGLNFLKM